MNKLRSLLLSSVVFLGACGLLGGAKPNPVPSPVVPAEVSVSVTQETEAALTYRATCEVVNDVAGAVEACVWDVKVNGTAITAPANGLITTFTVNKPAPAQTITILVSAKALRRGLLCAEITKTVTYTADDVAPVAPTAVTVAFVEVGDSLRVTLTCNVVAGQDIETCQHTVTRSVQGTAAMPVTFPNGLTSTITLAKPIPAQTHTFNVSSRAVRRTLVSDPVTAVAAYTQPDVAPPAPTSIIVEITP